MCLTMSGAVTLLLGGFLPAFAQDSETPIALRHKPNGCRFKSRHRSACPYCGRWRSSGSRQYDCWCDWSGGRHRKTGSANCTDWCWKYVDGAPLLNRWEDPADIPASTPLSTHISKEMKATGFRFCGPTIVYAWMQAVGIVNDHLVTCAFRE